MLPYRGINIARTMLDTVLSEYSGHLFGKVSIPNVTDWMTAIPGLTSWTPGEVTKHAIDRMRVDECWLVILTLSEQILFAVRNNMTRPENVKAGVCWG